MRLDIRHFAKIKQADIIIDGITVIAGENNTGKSTVGKILFSLFNAVSDIENKIARQRAREIEENSRMLLRNQLLYSGKPRNPAARNVYGTARKLAEEVTGYLKKEGKLEDSRICEFVTDCIKPLFAEEQAEELDKAAEELTEKIAEIVNLSEETITLEILSRYFSDMFHGQINSLTESGTKAELDLMIKNSHNKLRFEEDACVCFEPQIPILHKAIYIDNPFVIDKLDHYDELNVSDNFLRELLTSASRDGIMDGIIGTMLAKERLGEIDRALRAVVSGQIVEQKDDEFYLKDDGFGKPVSFHNLSTGLKSFVVIKMLIEKGILREKDVLILDEPEIHLHPQWQIAYAELIVLLQKYFDLSVVVTTHSPYFLDAIDLYSAKYGLGSKVNYYLSAMEGNCAGIRNVNGDIEMIYKKMASPIQMLDSLRHELNQQQ